MFCPTCGAEQPGDARFCGVCGSALSGGPAPPPSRRASFLRWIALAAGGGALAGILVLSVFAMADRGEGEPPSGGLATPTPTPSPAPAGATATVTTPTVIPRETATPAPPETPGASPATASPTPTPAPSPTTGPTPAPTASPTPRPPTATAIPPTPTPAPPTPTPTATQPPPTATPTKVPPTPTAPALSLVSGTVYLYFEGEPLEVCSGCRTRFEGPAGTYETMSNASGGYSIQLPPGDYDLSYPCPSPLGGEFWVYTESITIAPGANPSTNIYRGYCY